MSAVPFVYLDYNATSPVDPRVIEVYVATSRQVGNAASSHRSGRAARRCVEEARAEVARLVGASPSEIIFTSGTTEANALALQGALATRPSASLWLQPIEHLSLLRIAERLAVQGRTVLWRHSPQDLAEAHDGFVSCMLAQNETGEVFSIAALSRQLQGCHVLLHSDAAQAVGRIGVDVQSLGVDLLSFSAHKMGGPLGIGALYVRRGISLASLLPGQEEQGLRAGTLPVPLIAAFGCAARLAREEFLPQMPRVAALRDQLVAGLCQLLPEARLTAAMSPRLPNTAHLVLPQPCDGEELIARLDEAGICVSTGAACASGERRPSHVLRAMGFADEEARASLRVSLGVTTTEAEISYFLQKLPCAYQAAREVAQ